MAITWRPATPSDIEPCLAIQPRHLGDALVGAGSATAAWKRLAKDRFFASCLLESSSLPRNNRIVGLGASVFISPAFADAEIATPSPDYNSRVMAGLCSGHAVLATADEVARANAGAGVDVLVLSGTWRDEGMTPADRLAVQTLMPASFAEWLAGYRIRRIINEAVDQPMTEFMQRSIVYRKLAEFPEAGRTLFIMDHESVRVVPGSIGNVIFSYREPMLRLRDSDQQLLLAALRGATDSELANELGVTFSAVKARWRSVFVRIAETMPDLVTEADDHEGRGLQKRHRVLAYVRNHMEELRPYDWKAKR